jgi:hypothetical protein
MRARDRPSRQFHCLHECIPHVSSDRAGTNIFYMNPRHLFESVFEQRIRMLPLYMCALCNEWLEGEEIGLVLFWLVALGGAHPV